MAISAYAFFVTHSFEQGLPQGNSNIFDGVVRIDVQVAFGANRDIHHAMPCDLIDHVIQKRHTGFQSGLASTIQTQFNADLSFEGIACDLSLAHGEYCDGCKEDGLFLRSDFGNYGIECGTKLHVFFRCAYGNT